MSSPVYTSKTAVTTNHYLDTLKYWSIISAYGLAASEGVRLTQDHIDVLIWLREQFDEYGHIDVIATLQQLAVMYGPNGGESFLYALFPKEPIVQSMWIAGLPVADNEKLSLAS